ncbi:MAG: beta-ketoacyl synthase N-terminal-like domain-containing protein [Gammaproteobacteria bacterium]
MHEVVISGLGVVSAIGQGKAAFADSLMAGRSAFGLLRRPGRQLPDTGPLDGEAPAFAFIGAEIDALAVPAAVPARSLRTASLSSQAALAAVHEAWQEARLDEVSPERIGLIVGGSNFQQRELACTHAAQARAPHFVKPVYGHAFMDSDLCGLCTEVFAIRAFAHTVGGASASGQLAVLQAIAAVQSGQADVCIAVGALMDLSYWELQALRSMGAMGSDRWAHDPQAACRPYDARRDGFIFGEACGALVVERADRIERGGLRPYARCLGGAVAMDGNRNPNPSLEGERRVITQALAAAGLAPGRIDYVNPHATASQVGDETELQALRACGLEGAWINATKSITGHGLAAAGAVEVIATLLQMRAQRLHPTLNLEEPIDPGLRFVRGQAQDCDVKHALTLSIGFGGINTALCLQGLDG